MLKKPLPEMRSLAWEEVTERMLAKFPDMLSLATEVDLDPRMASIQKARPPSTLLSLAGRGRDMLFLCWWPAFV